MVIKIRRKQKKVFETEIKNFINDNCNHYKNNIKTMHLEIFVYLETKFDIEI